MKNLYSLEDLAWISRCLFPVDFYNELLEMGVEQQTAYDLSCFARPNPQQQSKNILDVYQGCLCAVNEEIKQNYINILEQYINNFLGK